MSELRQTDQANLPKLGLIIARDFYAAGRLPLFLLLLIFASAMAIVLTTHKTREIITQKDQALVQREKLDEEWRNLILEENALSEHSRVQRLAISELEMQRPDSDKEVIVRLK